jgi:hypothetical protein
LSRFISRLGEKGLPLYLLKKNHEHFSWTIEAQEALDKLKASVGEFSKTRHPRNVEFN